MKILVIGTIDKRGGAAQVSWELRKRLKAEGHTVSTFVRYKYSDEPDVFVIPRRRFQDWLVKLFANDLRFARTKYIFDTKEYREADIIHCHNLHSNFFNLKDLVRMSQEKPVVWTIHDLWAITGFASDSVTLRNPNKKKFLLFLWDRTPALLRAKKRIYEQSKLHIVAVSDWLKQNIETSVLGGQKITRIYNGIDTRIFKPSDKQSARTQLGLPLDKKIIGFGIKGWTNSVEVMERFKDSQDVYFISIGHPNIANSYNHKSFGFISDPALLAQILSVMDVFLYPTQGDTFGLSPAEAIACGTPVVTFNVDAMPEIVKHRETGYVARLNDIEDLITGIQYALEMKGLRTPTHVFDIEKTYSEYLALYRTIIDEEEAKKP